jgi:hypothetical protein
LTITARRVRLAFGHAADLTPRATIEPHRRKPLRTICFRTFGTNVMIFRRKSSISFGSIRICILKLLDLLTDATPVWDIKRGVDEHDAHAVKIGAAHSDGLAQHHARRLRQSRPSL